jgi:prevent-host-death family protein
MPRRVSIVEARRELGRLADEVSRTGQPVVLTRRGRAIARIAPAPEPRAAGRKRADAFGELRGTVRLACGIDELRRAIRALRSEAGRSLGRRAAGLSARPTRARA